MRLPAPIEGRLGKGKKGDVRMFLPPEYYWLEPVLVAAAVVFVVDLIGNVLVFGNRFANALVTALVFAVIFGALANFGIVRLNPPTVDTAPLTQPSGPTP